MYSQTYYIFTPVQRAILEFVFFPTHVHRLFRQVVIVKIVVSIANLLKHALPRMHSFTLTCQRLDVTLTSDCSESPHIVRHCNMRPLIITVDIHDYGVSPRVDRKFNHKICFQLTNSLKFLLYSTWLLVFRISAISLVKLLFS